MKTRRLIAIALVGAGYAAHVQATDVDSLRTVNLQEVQVVSNRATAKTPVAYTNIGQAELKQVNFGQDIPYLLGMTPSTLTTSDAGAGIGYTTLRVRGTDGTRINVTVNGIPMNDAESHNLFWVNMPDFSSSVKDLQVQRGAGTSTNGAGAFGASVNMQTESAAPLPYAEFDGSYGSFNTHKETVKVGTGLLHNHWTFDARLSNIGTDGYIDRAAVDLNSYFLQGGYFADNTSVKLIAFAGKEKTYHAWNYATKEEMAKYGRRYNSCGEYTDDNGQVQYYADQTDNYLQKNYQLLFNHRFSTDWNLNLALHYTKGDGYYEEYKSGASFVAYSLKPFVADGTDVTKSDLVRRKMMDNKFGGGIFSIQYTAHRLSAILGGGLNQYRGNNFGRVIWVKNYVGALDPNHEYYRSRSRKTDGNIYLRANYDLTKTLSAYADLQYRHIGYTIDGSNDKYDWNKGAMRPLAVDEKFDFFNPKVGLNWDITPGQRAYASFSVAQKEPTRNNYTDGDPNAYPRSERLFDYEVGYSFANRWLTAGANFYYMDYHDQLVLTGALNEIGEPLTQNVPDSYRTGIELMLGVKPFKGFRWDINATWSRNRIKNFVEEVPVYDDSYNLVDTKVTVHKSTRIAFSPDFLLNNRFTYIYKGIEASLQSQFVGKQYMSNAEVEAQTLDKYFVSNLNVAYTFKPRKLVKSITVGLTVYNLFNEEYENNGWASSAYYGTQRSDDAGYAAQAGTNVLAHLSIRF
ncbi:MAG: TonB-dependent receptor [Mediterranea sp.]|jgi:iron complex outermembrane receptor protein|nr:TonB-dependent receptor [Mediterranea sp.]